MYCLIVFLWWIFLLKAHYPESDRSVVSRTAETEAFQLQFLFMLSLASLANETSTILLLILGEKKEIGVFILFAGLQRNIVWFWCAHTPVSQC